MARFTIDRFEAQWAVLETPDEKKPSTIRAISFLKMPKRGMYSI